MVSTRIVVVFFFNDTATTEIYTLSLHDALPIYARLHRAGDRSRRQPARSERPGAPDAARGPRVLEQRSNQAARSEEHTSELQSRQYLVCRLLLEKKNTLPSHAPQSIQSLDL